MQIFVDSPEQYQKSLPVERQEAIDRLRKVIKANLPEGFVEEMNYGMIGYVVPHSVYPKGYHCNPKLPLPFMSIASQKNFIAVYHMGIYANNELMQWFVTNYADVSEKKIDMGKSCIRFKKPENIPFDLIGKLAGKMSVQDWINCYESAIKK